MAKTTLGLKRAIGILTVADAYKRGLNRTGWIKELRAKGLGYRKTVMLADWRSITGEEIKKDRLKYVRKDRYPTSKDYVAAEWPWKEEWAYKMKVRTVVRPDEPVQERFVIIESNKPLTPAEMEAQTWSRWGEWEKYAPERLKEVLPYIAYRRTPSPVELE